MKLEIKHLAPYLPYNLKGFEQNENTYPNVINELVGIVSNEMVRVSLNIFPYSSNTPLIEFKPILRPLADLTKEIMVNGEDFVPIDYFEIGDDYNDIVDYGKGNVKLIGLLKDMAEHNFIHLCYMNYGVMIKLFEWHFDVFGLIEKGLAIDINNLKH